MSNVAMTAPSFVNWGIPSKARERYGISALTSRQFELFLASSENKIMFFFFFSSPSSTGVTCLEVGDVRHRSVHAGDSDSAASVYVMLTLPTRV